MIKKIMKKLHKPFEPITTLTIIYFALVAVSIALYALIQIFFKLDTATATGLLGWSATMFATIALLYTVNTWREQKNSEVLSTIALSAYEKTDKLLDSYYKLKDVLLEINQYNFEGLTFEDIYDNLNIFNELIDSINRDIYLILKSNYSNNLENVKSSYEISKEDISKYIIENIHQYVENKQYKSESCFYEELEKYKNEIRNVIRDEIKNDEMINIIKNTETCKDLLSNYILHGLSNYNKSE